MADRLFVPGDFTSGVLATFLSLAGSVINQIAFPSCEQMAKVASGISCVQSEDIADPDLDIASIDIYNSSQVLIVSNSSIIIPDQEFTSPVCSDGLHTFYVALVDRNQSDLTIVKTISDTGIVGPTSWTLDNSFGVQAMGVKSDNTVLYYGPSVPFQAQIYRWDLVNDLPLSNLITSSANNRIGRDILILSNGNIIVCWWETTGVSDWEVRCYNSAGVQQWTTVIGPSANGGISPPRIGLSSDESVVWAMSFDPDINTSKFQPILTADGSITTGTFSVDNGHIDPNGPSQSCPVLLLGDVVPPVTNAGSGIYQLVPGKTHDTIYVTQSPLVTEDIPIPNPKVEGFLSGDD